MKTLAWLIAAITALTVLTTSACGGGDDDGGNGDGNGTPAALTENDLAEAMLLVLDDLPAGWFRIEPDNDDEPNPLDECDTGNSPGLIGTADSDDFTQEPGGLAEVSQDIRIFNSEEDLFAALDDFEEIADCISDLVDDGVLDDESATFGDFEFGQIEYETFGDESRTYRMSMVVTATDPDAEPPTVDFFIDMVFVAIDNVGMRIAANDIFDPYDPDVVAGIVELGEAKVRDILANGPGETAPPSETAPAAKTDPPQATSEEDTPPPNLSGAGASRDDPIPFGESGVILGRMQIEILDADYDAEDDILDFNQINDPSPTGKNMVLISVAITNVGERPLDVFFDPFWNLIGANGTPYDEFTPSCGVTPDELDGELLNGQSTQGNVCVQADEDDSDLVFFVEMYDDDFNIQTLYLALP